MAADLSEYKAELEYIQQLYSILNADYAARVSGTARTYTSTDLAKTVPGLAKTGAKLHTYFLADVKTPHIPEAELTSARDLAKELRARFDAVYGEGKNILADPDFGEQVTRIARGERRHFAAFLTGAGFTQEI